MDESRCVMAMRLATMPSIRHSSGPKFPIAQNRAVSLVVPTIIRLQKECVTRELGPLPPLVQGGPGDQDLLLHRGKVVAVDWQWDSEQLTPKYF